MTARWHLLIKGRVQGVGFRWFARETAERLRLSGWVRNLMSGEVEAEVEGPSETLKRFVAELAIGLSYARVSDIQKNEIPVTKDKSAFGIR